VFCGKTFSIQKHIKTSVLRGTKVWSILAFLSRERAKSFLLARFLFSDQRQAMRGERGGRKSLFEIINQAYFSFLSRVNLKSISNNKCMQLLWAVEREPGKFSSTMGMEIVYWFNKRRQKTKPPKRIKLIPWKRVFFLIALFYYRVEFSFMSLINRQQKKSLKQEIKLLIYFLYSFDIKMQLVCDVRFALSFAKQTATS
jgi:hypothetical protein